MTYTSLYDASGLSNDWAQIDPTAMQAVTSAGNTVTDVTPSSFWECVPQKDDLSGAQYERGHTYTGAVELDVPTNTVRLELPLGDGGWYWDVPASVG